MSDQTKVSDTLAVYLVQNPDLSPKEVLAPAPAPPGASPFPLRVPLAPLAPLLALPALPASLPFPGGVGWLLSVFLVRGIARIITVFIIM